MAKPQVSHIPSGGVGAGDGSTAGIRTLPKTGGDELLLILVGVAALTAGGLLVAGAPRRTERGGVAVRGTARIDVLEETSTAPNGCEGARRRGILCATGTYGTGLAAV